MRPRRTARTRSRSSGSEARPAATPSPLDVAARLLVRAPRTEAELERRLLAMGYRDTTAAKTVARCRDLGYVGDERLAHDRARQLRQRGAGSLKIAADLEARGLAEALVHDAVTASLDGEPEATWARRALTRAGHQHGPRAWRLLASRGFPDDVVTAVLGEPE